MNNTLKINKTRLNNYTISDVKNWIPCSKIKHAKNMQKTWLSTFQFENFAEIN